MGNKSFEACAGLKLNWLKPLCSTCSLVFLSSSSVMSSMSATLMTGLVYLDAYGHSFLDTGTVPSLPLPSPFGT